MSNNRRLRPATEPAPEPVPPKAPTGEISIEATMAALHQSADALEHGFDTMMDPASGVVETASAGLNGLLAVVGAPFEMLDTGLSMMTADLGALAPGMPVATLGDTHIGTPHAHAHPPSLIPPGPPVPLPSVGPVMAAGCVSVVVKGLPVARASDVGIAVTCGSFFPIFEIYTGSSNTFVGGSRAARATGLTRHCNPASAMGRMGAALGSMGAAAGLLNVAQLTQAGGNPALAAAMQSAQVAADSAALAMSMMIGKDPAIGPGIGAMVSTHADVLIGGFPMPDAMELMGPMLKLANKALKGLRKGKKVASWAAKGQLCLNPSEPISLVTGEVYNDFEDHRWPGADGWTWTRHYRSGWAHQRGPMGRGFRHSLDLRLWVGARAIVFSNFNGEEIRFAGTSPGHYEPASCGYRLLIQEGGWYAVQTARGEGYRFCGRNGSDSPRLEQVTRGGGVVLDLVYDEQGQLTSITQAKRDLRVHLEYDQAGQIVALDEYRGAQEARRVVQYGYDAQGHLTAFENPRGGRYGYAYGLASRPGLMTRAWDPRGYGFTWRYNAQDQCVHCRGDDGLWEVWMEYHPSTTRVTHADGGVWTYQLSQEQTVLEVQDPCGGVCRYFQGEDGRVSNALDPAGRITHWLYDSAGHHFGRLDPFGALLPPEEEDPNPSTGRELPTPTMPLELLHGVQEARLTRTQLPFDTVFEALPRGPSLADPGGRRTFAHVDRPWAKPVLRYDPAGAVCERIDEEGRREQYLFSELGECVAVTDPDDRMVQRHYGSWSLVQTKIDPLGAKTHYSYDHREAITRITDPGGHTVRYERDRCGRIIKIFNGDKLEERYERDSAGRVVKTFDGQQKLLLEYEYGENGECSRRRQASSGKVHRYEYDAQGMITDASDEHYEVELRYDAYRRVQLDMRDGQGVEIRGDASRYDWVLFDKIIVQYELQGDRTTITTPCGSKHVVELLHGCSVLREHPGRKIEFSHFDPLGRCTGKIAWTGPYPETLDWTARYKRSLGGDLLEIQDSLRGTFWFQYDEAHRITQREEEYGAIQDYRYDAAGNLRANAIYQEMEVDARNQLVRADNDTFSYNDRFNLVEHRQGDLTTTYEYDDADRLVRVDWSDGRESWRAGYDGLGRRMWTAIGEAVTQYYWEDNRLVAEVRPDASARVYVYSGRDSFVPILFLDYNSIEDTPGLDQVSYVYSDASGMPSHITNWRGEVVWVAEQVDVYGTISGTEYRRMHYNLRWPGHYWDEATGLHYNRFRSYSPRLGRYLQSDPMGQAGGVNVYAYPADPLGVVDLYGLVHQKATTGSKTKPGRRKPASKEADDGVFVVRRHRAGNRQVMKNGALWNLPEGMDASKIPDPDEVGDLLQASAQQAAGRWKRSKLSRSESKAIRLAQRKGEYWRAHLLERQARGRWVEREVQAEHPGMNWQRKGPDIVHEGLSYDILSGTNSNIDRHARRMSNELFRLLVF